jgi:hypothetical protein
MISFYYFFFFLAVAIFVQLVTFSIMNPALTDGPSESEEEFQVAAASNLYLSRSTNPQSAINEEILRMIKQLGGATKLPPFTSLTSLEVETLEGWLMRIMFPFQASTCT